MTQSRLQWLEIQLDREDLTRAEFDVLNKEANDLQQAINDHKAQSKAIHTAQTQFDKDCLIINELVKAGRMMDVVEQFGNEFVDDYSITDNFTVLSACFNPRNPNAQNVWECTSMEAALKKKFQLIYWRVYERYIRNVQVKSQGGLRWVSKNKTSY